MGASMSSSFLYKIVAIVEIVCSAVIATFGVNTFLLFNGMDEGFQAEKEMIQYSSIVAVVQSILTLFATFILICCHHSSLQQEINFAQEHSETDKKRPSQIGHQYSLRRKAIAPTWTAWTLISIASLLFVVISPIHYCIQGKADLAKFASLQFGNSGDKPADNKLQGICHSTAPEVAPIRNSLSDLYSFSIISLLFKSLFVIMVHRNWRSELRKEKKIIIYVDRPESSNNIENEMEGEQSAAPKTTEGGPKIMVAAPNSASTGHQESGESLEGRELLGEGQDGKKGKIQLVSEKGKK